MSAYWAVAFPNRVEIVSDGAVFNPNGILTGRTAKTVCSALLPIATVGVGTQSDIAEMKLKVMQASEAESVDAALQLMRETLPTAPKHEELESTILIAALSEQDGPILYTYSNVRHRMVYRHISHAFGPGLATEQLLALGIDFQFPNGLKVDGVTILDAMRKEPCQPFAEIPQGHYVGAFIDWTVIDASGARTERVHEWPDDVIGQPIRP